ncbi:MAG TPA: hypothetical protein PK867_31345, partial [Pirellulales bacterium]|nr:hypothetical protein [Pirellulales bacterium]
MAASKAPPQAVDLLRLIDPARDARIGKWEIIDGRLLFHADGDAQIEFPFDPPEEYVLTAIVLPTLAEDRFLLGLPVGKSQALVTLNGQEAELSLIDRLVASDNETTRPGPWLSPFISNVVECKVRKNQIQVTCNGVLAVNWTGDADRLSLPRPWKASSKPRVFIGGQNASVQVPQMLLSPLRDAAGPTRDSIVKATDGPVDLLKRIEPSRDAVLGEWRRDGDALTSPSGWRSRIQVPVVTPEHYRLTAVVSREGKKDQGGWIVFGLPVGKYHTAVVIDNADRRDPFVGLNLLDGKRADGNESRGSISKLPEGTPMTVACTVHPDHVNVQVDGKQVLDWHGDARRLSTDFFWSPADWSKLFVGAACGVRFGKLQLEALDPQSAAEKNSVVAETSNGATPGAAVAPPKEPAAGETTFPRGRYVRVELPRTGTISLAEVEVYIGGRNIARSGKAT